MADLTEDEMTEIAQTFKAMGVKPKCKDPVDFQQWMLDYLAHEGKLPEVKAEPSRSDSTPSKELIITQQQLRLPTFSGDSSKSDVTYDLWRNEIDCLLRDKTYSEVQILQAARKSLRGEAAGVSLRMRTEGTIHDLLKRLEAVYGTVELGETLLSQFYSAQQKDNESVATWGCRLEDILDKARRRGQVASDAMDEMLRTKFWTGLRPELKASSRHKFDTVKHFDILRVELRAIEYEQQVCQKPQKETQPDGSSKPKVQVKAAVPVPASTSGNPELQELKGMVLSLQKQMQTLQNLPSNQGPPNMGQVSARTTPFGTRMPAPIPAACPQMPFQQPYFRPAPFQAPRSGPPLTQPHSAIRPPMLTPSRGPRPSRFGPCFNCGGGHMKRDCPSLQQQAHLNMIAQTLGGECLPRTNPAPTWMQPQEMQTTRGPPENSWWDGPQRQTFA